MKVETVKRKEEKSKIPAVTVGQKLTSLLARIQQSLTDYESTDAVDQWNVDFTIGMKFKGQEFSLIQVHHKRLLETESTANNLKLLVRVEIGRMYDFLKYSEAGCDNWGNLCEDLGVCRATADRYIDFSRIVCAYPRLLICEISVESVVCLYRALQEHLLGDEQLAYRPKFLSEKLIFKAPQLYFLHLLEALGQLKLHRQNF
jgi:hypothetical protein